MILKRVYWIKNRDKPLRRSINRKKQKLRQVFLYDTCNFKGFWIWYDTNMTSWFIPWSFLATLICIHVSFPMNTSGWENLSGKAISIKYNFPFSQISQLFQDSFIFGEATSPHFFKVTIRHNSCFFGAAISSEQLVFWGVPISKQ